MGWIYTNRPPSYGHYYPQLSFFFNILYGPHCIHRIIVSPWDNDNQQQQIYFFWNLLCYYMALLLNTKNSFSKKAAFEYTHTYSSTIGDMSDLNSNA